MGHDHILSQECIVLPQRKTTETERNICFHQLTVTRKYIGYVTAPPPTSMSMSWFNYSLRLNMLLVYHMKA